jgi:hypothetical protein
LKSRKDRGPRHIGTVELARQATRLEAALCPLACHFASRADLQPLGRAMLLRFRFYRHFLPPRFRSGCLMLSSGATHIVRGYLDAKER